MTKQQESMLGIPRFNALLAWWGIPNANGNGDLDARMKRFQAFASDLQKTFAETSSHEQEALTTTNERLTSSFQELFRSRNPQEVMAAQSLMLATYLDEMSLHAKTWLEITQKVHECCAAVARETAEELRRHDAGETNAKPNIRPVRAGGRAAAE